MHLTDLGIRGLPFVPSGQKDYHDDALGGFSVRVGTRSKTFMLIVKSNGRRHRVKLGTYPDLTLAKAREKAKDILAEQRMKRPEPEQKPRVLYIDALATWQATYCETRMRPRSRVQAKQILARHFSKLKRRPLDTLTREELARRFDALADRPSEAFNAFVYLRSFLNWCVRRGYLDASPLAKLDQPKREPPRERVLTDAEIAALWLHAPDTNYGRAIKLCILTGQRIGQWREWKPEYWRGDRIVWPAAAMKANRTHELPATDGAATLLRGCSGMQFSQGGKHKIRLARAVEFADWQNRDIRRTVATKLAELRVAPHIIERILAHQTGEISGVAATYNRYSYFVEVKTALELWEARLQAILAASRQAA